MSTHTERVCGRQLGVRHQVAPCNGAKRMMPPGNQPSPSVTLIVLMFNTLQNSMMHCPNPKSRSKPASMQTRTAAVKRFCMHACRHRKTTTCHTISPKQHTQSLSSPCDAFHQRTPMRVDDLSNPPCTKCMAAAMSPLQRTSRKHSPNLPIFPI